MWVRAWVDGWKEHVGGCMGVVVGWREWMQSRHIGRVGTWGGVDGEVGGWRGGWLMGPWTRYASIEVVK